MVPLYSIGLFPMPSHRVCCPGHSVLGNGVKQSIWKWKEHWTDESDEKNTFFLDEMPSYACIYCSNSVALSVWPTLQEASSAENKRMVFLNAGFCTWNHIITNLLISWVLGTPSSPHCVSNAILEVFQASSYLDADRKWNGVWGVGVEGGRVECDSTKSCCSFWMKV